MSQAATLLANSGIDQRILRKIDAGIVERSGFERGSAAEDAAVVAVLRHCSPKPTQQVRVGKFRLDFAWPEIRAAIEIDGPHHRNPDAAFRDAERDRWLRGEGWLVFRVSAYAPTFEDEVLRAWLAVRSLGEHQEWRYR